MSVFSEHDVSLLPVPHSDKVIVYLPFAQYAAVIDAVEQGQLEEALAGKGEGMCSVKVHEILAKARLRTAKFYKTRHSADGLRSLMLLPNNMCNFRCRYCYSAKGRSHKEISLGLLKAGLKYFLDAERAKGERLSISVLGGGEPLLSWHLLKPALEYAFMLLGKRKSPCPVSLVTNGSICTDEIIHFCMVNGISLSVSFDILEDVQNAQRGHWKKVSDNINRFAQSGIDVAINAVISGENVCRMSEMIEHLVKFNPLVKKVSFKTLIAKDYFRSVEERRKYYQCFIQHFFQAKTLADRWGLWLTCSYMNACLCLADRYCPGKFVITSEGDLSVCHTVGSKQDDLYNEFVFGHIHPSNGEVSVDEEKLEKILSHDVFHRASCEECPARWHCAGGCYADFFHMNEEEHEAYCESMRLFLSYYLIYKYHL